MTNSDDCSSVLVTCVTTFDNLLACWYITKMSLPLWVTFTSVGMVSTSAMQAVWQRLTLGTVIAEVTVEATKKIIEAKAISFPNKKVTYMQSLGSRHLPLTQSSQVAAIKVGLDCSKSESNSRFSNFSTL